MAKKVVMTLGLPGSGKSWWAKAEMQKHPGVYIRTNKDLLRDCLHHGQWTRANEKFTLQVRDSIITEALSAGNCVIVDDTNFGGGHEARLRELAKQHAADFVLMDFTEVPIELCIERDRLRANPVGEKVIRDMHDKYLRKTIEPPPYDPNLPLIVITDVDGTIAQMNGRGPFEWKRVGEDLVRQSVVDAVIALAKHKDAMIMVLSGRDACCYPETERWIQEKAKIFLHPGMLHMRPVGDMRRDSIVKREIYDNHIKGKFEVVGIFDDRPQVLVETWRALGLGDRLFNVGDGRVF